MIKKVVNVEEKASFQPFLEIKKIDIRYLKSYKLTNKDKSSWDHRDEDKTRSHNLFLANASQPQTPTQTQASKKDEYHQESWQSYPAIRVNIIKVAKKNKDKTKNLSYIKYYTYKQKDHYANKCPKKPKNW